MPRLLTLAAAAALAAAALPATASAAGTGCVPLTGTQQRAVKAPGAQGVLVVAVRGRACLDGDHVAVEGRAALRWRGTGRRPSSVALFDTVRVAGTGVAFATGPVGFREGRAGLRAVRRLSRHGAAALTASYRDADAVVFDGAPDRVAHDVAAVVRFGRRSYETRTTAAVTFATAQLVAPADVPWDGDPAAGVPADPQQPVTHGDPAPDGAADPEPRQPVSHGDPAPEPQDPTPPVVTPDVGPVDCGDCGAVAPNSPPVAQNATYNLNNVASAHRYHLPASDPDGDPLTYRVTLQSFAAHDFNFAFDAASGYWSTQRLTVSGTVWFRYVAIDSAGNVSNEATVTFKYS